jgi:GGDEF domain-containing protein
MFKQETNFAVDRRVDAVLRKRVDEMSMEERGKALLTDEMTGLPNARAYMEAPQLPIQVVADLDGLKWVNDHLGYEAGNAMILAAATVFQQLGLTAYRAHTSGDEFILQFDGWAEACTAMRRVRLRLQETTFVGHCGMWWRGIGISYGISDSVRFAERRLKLHKKLRLTSGERAAREEKPVLLQGVAQR